jgi:CheY-like chemotaxis protein
MRSSGASVVGIAANPAGLIATNEQSSGDGSNGTPVASVLSRTGHSFNPTKMSAPTKVSVTTQTPAETEQASPRPRVLIVEDDADCAHSLQALLSSAGYDACCASDGANGLAAAMQFDPHFVLLDLQLPRVHGVEVARHLRANEESLRRVIIVISGVSQEMLDGSICDRHLPKPIDPEQLLWILADEWQERFAGTPLCY